MLSFPQWAGALVKDGKQLYEAEKSKRESFGKLFSKCFFINNLHFLRKSAGFIL